MARRIKVYGWGAMEAQKWWAIVMLIGQVIELTEDQQPAIAHSLEATW